MEQFQVYIPMDRRAALAQGLELPDRAHGSALFGDISGFTPLTEALARELGPQRGAEELTRILNRVYDALINELHDYGGIVISFSGDAITCWFEGDEGLRATTCALGMQETMKQFDRVAIPTSRKEAPTMPFSLAMKVSVATGPVRRFIVGDREMQLIDVLAGETLERLAAGEHQAGKGEVVLDQQTVAALGDGVQLAEWRRDPETGMQFGAVERLERPATSASFWGEYELDEEQIRDWILQPVYERLSTGQGEFLAELRPGVALFLRFGGINYDEDDEAGEKLDAFIQWVQRVVGKYQAFLLNLTIGDKGSYIYASFGAPIAHEDDAIRSVSAALELLSVPQELNFIKNLQIGISQGRIFSGSYGGTRRRTYGVMGDEVNLAARLMQAAEPGQVLVSQIVKQAAENDFHWQSLPDIEVKGKVAPVSVYRPLEPKQRRTLRLQAPEYALPMVGREQERSISKAKLDQALRGQGQIIGIIGEAGVGKTRLAAEVILWATVDHGMAGFGGECESYDTESSYLVWQPIWRSFFGIDATQTREEQIESVSEKLKAIDPSLEDRLPILSPAIRVSIPDNDLTRSMDAKLRKSSLESMLLTCLEWRAKQTPLLIVLEDCHWMDPLSHDLVEVVGRAIADLPVLVVMSYRPPEITRLVKPRVSELPNFTLIRLSDFDAEEAEKLINLKLGQSSQEEGVIPKEFTERIMSRAQGNPFYIEELMNYLRDQGIDPRDEEALAELELPTSLHSLILSRLDQLTERQKTTLKVASVIGRLFQAAYVWGMYPELGTPEVVKSDLEKISDMQLTIQDPSEPELTYFFKQVVTQEVAYENLPYATRAMLHGQFARYIEQNFQETVGGFTYSLAYHYLKGEIWDKALAYNRQASEYYQREFANEAAISACQNVLDAAVRINSGVDTTQDELAAHERLGEVLTLVGRYDEALEHYDSARSLVEHKTKSASQMRRLTELCRKTAEVYERRSEFEVAFDWLQKGLNLLDVDELYVEAARIYRLGAAISYRQGKYEEAIDWGQKSIQIADKSKSFEGQQSMAHVNFTLGAVYKNLGEYRNAVEHCQRSVQIFQDIGDIVGLSNAYLNLASVYSSQGDWTQASDAYRQSLEIKEKVGDILHQGFITNNLGNVNLYRGEWDEAVELFEQSNAIWKQVGAALPEAVSLSNLAQVYIYQGKLEAARDTLSLSEGIFTKIASQGFLPELERRWGEYYLKTGDFDQALVHMNRSIELATSQEARLEEGMSTRVLGEVHLARGEREAAENALRHSLQILDELNSEYEAAKTKLSLARLAEDGEKTLDQALQTFERLGAKADLAEARELAKTRL